MRRVVVTGGLGYVGGRIVSHLLAAGEGEVVVASRDSQKMSDALPGARRVDVDLVSSASLAGLVEGADAVIHCAAMNEVDCAADAEGCMMANGFATLRLVQASERARVPRFIYLSTAHVYGSPLVGNIDESRVPRPVHPYAITHRVAEDFVLAAHSRKTLTGVVLRLSNAYGAPIDNSVNRWMLLVNDLCRQAIVQRKLVLKSTGLQFRDFIAMRDVVRAMDHFLELPAAKVGDGLFNLGGRNSMSIYDMTVLIANVCEQVLSFCPPIERPSGNLEKQEPLNYEISKLEQTGFTLMGNPLEEIAATLRLCREGRSSQ